MTWLAVLACASSGSHFRRFYATEGVAFVVVGVVIGDMSGGVGVCVVGFACPPCLWCGSVIGRVSHYRLVHAAEGFAIVAGVVIGDMGGGVGVCIIGFASPPCVCGGSVIRRVRFTGLFMQRKVLRSSRVW